MSTKVRSFITKSVPEFKLDSTAPGITAFKAVFQPQFYQYQAKSEKIQLATDYALNDARLCLEGEEILMGFSRTEVDLAIGSTKDILEELKNMTAAKFMTLVEKKGFIAKVSPGNLIVIPGGFVVVSISLSVVHGIRFQNIGGVRNMQCAVEYLNRTFLNHPKLETETHGKLRDFLVEKIALAAQD